MNNTSPERSLFVACIDTGGVLRSRMAAEVLKTFEITAIAYAARDISEQTFNGEVPLHVVGLFKKYGYNVEGDPIVQIPKSVVGDVTHFLVLCALNELPQHINTNDPRVCHYEVADVKALYDIPDYERAVRDVSQVVERFMNDHDILG